MFIVRTRLGNSDIWNVCVVHGGYFVVISDIYVVIIINCEIRLSKLIIKIYVIYRKHICICFTLCNRWKFCTFSCWKCN